MDKALDYFNINIPKVTPTDIVEMVILAYVIYIFLRWMRKSKAWWLLKGIGIVVGAFFICAVFRMHTILWIGEKLLSVFLIAIVIVFQPEIRKALEVLGRKKITNLFSLFTAFKGNNDKKFTDTTTTAIVTACREMGAVKTGALIVIENKADLSNYIDTGIRLDAAVSRQLLINIFEKNTPLHDGAVIIRGDRIISATSYLPLSDNMTLSKALGTRHRAALGLADVTDALIIVVSEETGRISMAQNGILKENVSENDLITVLNKMQLPEESENVEGGNKDERF